MSAIHFLREGRPSRELGTARAIFVTSNDRLVRASDWWFREQGKRSIVPQCISEISLTTQLWLRKPEGRPDVPRKFLIAESFAALNPGPELWERYLDRISRRRESGDITDEQVKVLVFSAEAKEGLIEITHGDPNQISDEAIMEVLARYEERVRAPLAGEVERAQKDIESLREHNEALRGTLNERDRRLKDQRDSLARQDRQLGDQQEQLDKLARAEQDRTKRERTAAEKRATARKVASIGLAVLVAAAAAVIWVTGTVTDAIARAGVGFVGACLAAAAVAWGLRRSLKWAGMLIITAGAFTALFFGLIAVADHDKATSKPAQNTGR